MVEHRSTSGGVPDSASNQQPPGRATGNFFGASAKLTSSGVMTRKIGLRDISRRMLT